MHIAVYGANGYQGKLVVAELARRGIGTVLAGRDATRLHQAATAVGATEAERRVAGTGDHDRLVAAFRGCDAVINCAGPFTPTGHAVVRAAIAAGCHYLDTAGEQLYIRAVFDAFTAEAERAGVTVVPAATDAAVPGDLVAHLLAERLGPIDEIAVSHVIAGGGGASRGTLRSLLTTIDIIKAGGLVFDDGTWHTGVPARTTWVTLPDDTAPAEVVASPLPEVVTIPRHVPVRYVEGLVDAALIARWTVPLTPDVIDALPEGPTAEGRGTQRFTYLLDATAADGRTARGTVRGVDTYGTTALIVVEAARRLVADGAKPGVRTPAQAFDATTFLDFLAPYGVGWTIDLTTT
jgi:short subunit dehydrogenase-like uncharacterized protein